MIEKIKNKKKEGKMRENLDKELLKKSYQDKAVIKRNGMFSGWSQLNFVLVTMEIRVPPVYSNAKHRTTVIHCGSVP